MKKKLTGRVSAMHGLAKKENDEHLYFHGTVKYNQGLAAGGAVVMLLACFVGGVEKPLGYTFTDQEGRYLIATSKLLGEPELLGYKLVAGKPDIPGQVFKCSDVSPQETSQGLETEEQRSVTERAEAIEDLLLSMPNQGSTTEEVKVSKKSDLNLATMQATMHFLLLFGVFSFVAQKNVSTNHANPSSLSL